MKISSVLKVSVLLCAIGFCTSCAKEELKPRTAPQITQDRMSLPMLCLTKSGKEIIVPGATAGRAVLDKTTGELAYPARICANPDCPGEGNGVRPYLFIWEDPTVFINDEDKSVGTLEPKSNEDFFDMCKEKGVQPNPTCPACLKSRNLAAESEEEAQKYRQWVRPYVLPETARRLKKLDEEHKRRIEELKRRKQRKLKKRS